MKTRRKKANVTYTVWTIIEKKIDWDNGDESYQELKQADQSIVGIFTTLDKAEQQVSNLRELHGNDIDESLE